MGAGVNTHVHTLSETLVYAHVYTHVYIQVPPRDDSDAAGQASVLNFESSWLAGQSFRPCKWSQKRNMLLSATADGKLRLWMQQNEGSIVMRFFVVHVLAMPGVLRLAGCSWIRTVGKGMRVDMLVGMHVGMRADVCVDMCVWACVWACG